MIQQQLEAARLERSHTPRGVILMWALGPWDQNNCICMVVSGCPHLSGIWGALGNSLIISAALFSLERRERLLRCLQPATEISVFSGFRCHKCRLVAVPQGLSLKDVWFLICCGGISARHLTDPQLQLYSSLFGRIIMDFICFHQR